jgi:hypothetical protein
MSRSSRVWRVAAWATFVTLGHGSHAPSCPCPWGASTHGRPAGVSCPTTQPPACGGSTLFVGAGVVSGCLVLASQSTQAAPGKASEAVLLLQLGGLGTMQKKPLSPSFTRCCAQPFRPVCTPPLRPSAVHVHPDSSAAPAQCSCNSCRGRLPVCSLTDFRQAVPVPQALDGPCSHLQSLPSPALPMVAMHARRVAAKASRARMQRASII